ncbi:MAG: hypothetical protein COB30_010540 [Ectothiorhodospiraceae bacterium]|nr:hypothetical protein [Ectothiorhodospiraceae bacterium]
MTRKRKLIYGGLALTIAVASWIGGYAFFVNSEEWRSAEQVIKKSEVIQSRVGNVKYIELSLWGFRRYSSSGNWAIVELDLVIAGDKDVADFSVEIEKNRKGVWKIKQVLEK